MIEPMVSMVRAIPKVDSRLVASARARQERLTKPPGSLGRLEELAIQLAGFQGATAPQTRPCSALIFASDHPVTEHGVSPYPRAVTRAMLRNFQAGGAASSVLARHLEVPLHVFDVGVQPRDVEPSSGEVAVPRHSGAAARLHTPSGVPEEGDVRVEDALSLSGFKRCLEVGSRAVREVCAGDRMIVLGEMGIGNTTLAAAVVAGLLGGEDAARFVGRGTGAEGAMLLNKRDVVRCCVARLQGERRPLEVLRRVGGRELVALYGAMREALCQRQVVLVDGFIVSAVALALVLSEPEAEAGLVFAHESHEQGHRAILEHLGARPVCQLGMRLGEASGALTALPLVELACTLHNNMATFDSAGVPDVTRALGEDE